MLRSRTRWVLMVGLLALAGCRHKIPPPYPPGQGPAAEALLERTGAQLPALQVSRAKVTANRTLRGNLAFIAEGPSRFRGSVEVAGNELVTLAFHEAGYALRYKLDAFPQGYYAGPPSACAVEALLGIAFDTEGLVDLVLGGAPVIEAPYEILDQGWDRRGGYETLTLANDRFVQQLRFGWVGDQWRVMGGQLWEREGGKAGRRLWTVEHLELVAEGGTYLPTKTKVSTPGKRRDDTVVINYKERNTDPAFAKRRSAGGGNGDPDPWEEGDPWEDEGDAWEDGADDGSWEDGADDGGWEDGAAPAEGAGPTSEGVAASSDSVAASSDGGVASTAATGPSPGDPGSTGEAKPATATTQGTKGTTHAPEASPTAPHEQVAPVAGADKPKPAAPEESEPAPIPPEFQLEPTGLTVRGDLCR